MTKQNTAIKEQEKHVVNFESLPLGQRLRRLGYRVIIDLSDELKCKEIAEQHNKDNVDSVITEIKDKYPNCRIKSNKTTIVRAYTIKSILHFFYFEQPLETKWVNLFICVPKIAKLENYIHDDIPTHLFDKVEKAKKDGLKDFFVAYPVIEKTIQTDPIIFSKLGDEMIFIGQWA